MLMGGPGSGKTTFLNFVALCLAGEILRSAGANLKLLRRPIPPEGRSDRGAAAKPKPQRWRHGALLPVRVVLRDFAASLPPPGTPATPARSMDLHRRPTARALRPYADPLQAELLGRGGLILLDGLDEVPDALSRREQVKTAVQEFAGMYASAASWSPAAPTPISARTGSSTVSPSASCCPSRAAQVERFIDGWYHHMAHDLFRISEAQAAAGAAMLKRATIRKRTARTRRAPAAADPDGAAADAGRRRAAGKPRGTVPPVGGHAARRMGRPQTAA
ncbi:MAG: hypothetical protein V5B36_13175 [Candidatus Accumulibacter sp. UW25]